LLLGGYCEEGFGGSPFRFCNDSQGQNGVFGEISPSCIQSFLLSSSCFLPKKIK